MSDEECRKLKDHEIAEIVNKVYELMSCDFIVNGKRSPPGHLRISISNALVPILRELKK